MLAEYQSAWCSFHWRLVVPGEYALSEPGQKHVAGARVVALYGYQLSHWQSKTEASGKTQSLVEHGFVQHDQIYLHKYPVTEKQSRYLATGMVLSWIRSTFHVLLIKCRIDIFIEEIYCN